VKILGFAVGIVYSAVQTALLALLLGTFPGYYDSEGSMASYQQWNNDLK